MIACDLGSNTLRIVEIDCKSGMRLREFERMVKTADELYKTGYINDAAIKRIITALHEAAEIFDFTDEDFYAVTTAAVRMASNAKEVLARIAQETGVRFIMIEAQEEAHLTNLAVSYRLQKLGFKARYLLMDLGGGSTEITLCEDAYSVDVGIVTMAQKYPTPKALEAGLNEALSPLFHAIEALYQKHTKPELFVATAGTPTTIAAFKVGLDYAHYDAQEVNGTMLSVDDLDMALGKLLAMPEKERERWVGVGRDALIIAGVYIVKAIMIEAGFTEMLVIDDGLREGVALQKCQEKSDTFSTS